MLFSIIFLFFYVFPNNRDSLYQSPCFPKKNAYTCFIIKHFQPECYIYLFYSDKIHTFSLDGMFLAGCNTYRRTCKQIYFRSLKNQFSHTGNNGDRLRMLGMCVIWHCLACKDLDAFCDAVCAVLVVVVDRLDRSPAALFKS